MKKILKRVLLAVILIPLLIGGGCTILVMTGLFSGISQSIQENEPWVFAIKSVKREGRLLKDPYGNQKEAAGTWVIIHVEVKNQSNERQSAKDIYFLEGISTKLIDSSGKEHDYDSELSYLRPKTFDEKPFNPGEGRLVKAVFDLPATVQPRQIEFMLGLESKIIEITN
ncbi:DUF4352 domain-containing protein [Alkalinema pantanalense CENA528]|uniref:DUF4352 domain-containing protein n=1 Tax=Alkalinema pantanalense TaxID=1620705 RepID=UPI003D6FA5B3